MKEDTYLRIINNTLSESGMLGDDCAFLPPDELGNNGLYITQDSLVERVHFDLKTISPYLLGKKSVQVNLSDLASACAKPLYITISLSLPKTLGEDFVREFYKGVNEVCVKVGVKVAGGDLTGSDKVFISITAIGKKTAKCSISRAFAKRGDVVLVSDTHGDSGGGLALLQEGGLGCERLINAHLLPRAELRKSEIIAQYAVNDIAVTDTSDGLADALFKIASAAQVTIDVDFDKIPVSDELKNMFPEQYKDFVLWGGEDYKLLCCVEPALAEKLLQRGFYKIGTVSETQDKPCVIINDKEKYVIDEKVFSQKSFNHFGEQEHE